MRIGAHLESRPAKKSPCFLRERTQNGVAIVPGSLPSRPHRSTARPLAKCRCSGRVGSALPDVGRGSNREKLPKIFRKCGEMLDECYFLLRGQYGFAFGKGP